MIYSYQVCRGKIVHTTKRLRDQPPADFPPFSFVVEVIPSGHDGPYLCWRYDSAESQHHLAFTSYDLGEALLVLDLF